MPEVPHPVPISTAALAPPAQARTPSVAPTAGRTGSVPPRSAALARAASSGSSSGRYLAAYASGPTRSSLAPAIQARELYRAQGRYLLRYLPRRVGLSRPAAKTGVTEEST